MKQLHELIHEVVAALTKNHWQLVTAESCTGGLVATCLTEVAGSSLWFERGFITYSNLAKEEMLAVPRELLDDFGAVSEPVAAAMALGALQNSAGQIAVSITGIAGPDGGSEEKPVGTVCFGWATRCASVAKTLKKQFPGDRQEVRFAACYEALNGVLAQIKKIS